MKHQRKKAFNKRSPADWQEFHSPTEPVMGKITATKEIYVARRRKLDARIFDSFQGRQEEAAELILLAFQHLHGGTGFGSMLFGERLDGGSGLPETVKQRWRESMFWDWGREVQAQRLSVAATLDWLCYDRALSRIDEDRRKRKGWAKENLLGCLTIYCKLCQWPHNDTIF